MDSVTINSVDQQEKRKIETFEERLVEVMHRAKNGDQTAKLTIELMENVNRVLPDVLSNILKLITEEKNYEARFQLDQALYVDKLYEQEFFYTSPRISTEYEAASEEFSKHLRTLIEVLPMESLPYRLEEAASTLESEATDYAYKKGFYEGIKYLEQAYGTGIAK